MNAIDRAKAAYRPDNAAVKTESAIEYEAFMRITSRLSRLDEQSAAFPERATAVFENRRLWTVLASAVMDPANGLSNDLRARIVYLSEFTHHHSQKVLFEKASVEPLIMVNTAVMNGLRQQEAAS